MVLASGGVPTACFRCSAVTPLPPKYVAGSPTRPRYEERARCMLSVSAMTLRVLIFPVTCCPIDLLRTHDIVGPYGVAEEPINDRHRRFKQVARVR